MGIYPFYVGSLTLEIGMYYEIKDLHIKMKFWLLKILSNAFGFEKKQENVLDSVWYFLCLGSWFSVTKQFDHK